MQFLLSAGEASGDTYGAQLAQALARLAPNSRFFGMGGEKMRAAGCELLIDAKDVAVVGLVEVVKHLPDIRRRFDSLVAEAARRKPDAAVLIDFPDFNLRLARELHRQGIPVFYFVSPQIWAWRTGRVKQIQKYVRKMIVIFPFEQEFYRRHGVEVSYVGHPLAYAEPPQITREEFAAQHGLNLRKQWIALLPGSRRKEVRLNLPPMVDAAELLCKQGEFEFVLPVASTLSAQWLRDQLEEQGLKPDSIKDLNAALKGRSSTEAYTVSPTQPSITGQGRPISTQETPSADTGSRSLGSPTPKMSSADTGWSRPVGAPEQARGWPAWGGELRQGPGNNPALAAEVQKSTLIHLTHNARATLQHARAAVVASGTATVEAALSGTPFVVVYRLAPLTWILGRRLVKLSTFAMPNLIAGEKIVPELIQKDFTAQNVLRELEAIGPDGPARTKMQNALKIVQERLRDRKEAESPAMRAAREVLTEIS
jgi:lipid-A-disaccharide synthase